MSTKSVARPAVTLRSFSCLSSQGPVDQPIEPVRHRDEYECQRSRHPQEPMSARCVGGAVAVPVESASRRRSPVSLIEGEDEKGDARDRDERSRGPRNCASAEPVVPSAPTANGKQHSQLAAAPAAEAMAPPAEILGSGIVGVYDCFMMVESTLVTRSSLSSDPPSIQLVIQLRSSCSSSTDENRFSAALTAAV